MKIYKDDFKFIKDEFIKDFVNKVYKFNSRSNSYIGSATIYAKDVIEANLLLKEFKEQDLDNAEDSRGYPLKIEEDDFTGEFTNEEAKINKTINYRY
jgi:hypothetical protein